MSPSSRPIAWRTGVDANDESCTTSTSSLGVEAAVVYDDEAALFARPSGPPSQRAQNWMGVRPSLRARAAGSRMRGVALHWSQCRSVRVHPLSIYSPNCRVSSALSSRNVELCLEARLLTQLSGKHKCHDSALTMADVSSSLDDMLRSAMGMSKVARREGQGSACREIEIHVAVMSASCRHLLPHTVWRGDGTMTGLSACVLLVFSTAYQYVSQLYIHTTMGNLRIYQSTVS